MLQFHAMLTYTASNGNSRFGGSGSGCFMIYCLDTACSVHNPCSSRLQPAGRDTATATATAIAIAIARATATATSPSAPSLCTRLSDVYFCHRIVCLTDTHKTTRRLPGFVVIQLLLLLLLLMLLMGFTSVSATRGSHRPIPPLALHTFSDKYKFYDG